MRVYRRRRRGLVVAVLAVLALAGTARAQTLASFQDMLDVLDASECSNCAAAGLEDLLPENPFEAVEVESHGVLVAQQDCFAQVESRVDLTSGAPRLRYRLENWPRGSANGTAGRFLTHTGPCAACSTLQSLAVYVRTRETMTEQAKACAISSFIDYLFLGLSEADERAGKRCFQRIGLRGRCRDIWFWNALNTGQYCALTCLGYRRSAPNEPQRASCSAGNVLCESLTADHCASCENTVNGENVCRPWQWDEGEFRLNPCLQCDECMSGPLFLAVAGRTRRASNIKSAIARPFDASEVDALAQVSWTYGYNVPPIARRSFLVPADYGKL